MTVISNSNPSIEVYVVTHKPIDFPLPDYCRKIQVNAESNGQWPGYLHDNDNPDNISAKNPKYVELTGLYSMWKNCKADIQGLYHYRRYFTKDSALIHGEKLILPNEVMKSAVSPEEIAEALENYDVILAKPQDVSLIYHYGDLTINEFFRRVCPHEYLAELWRVINEKFPEYLSSFQNVVNSHRYSPFNMFIARRDFVDSYCSWLFGVLGELERRISHDGHYDSCRIVQGYMSEFLLNVYVQKHGLRRKYFHVAKIGILKMQSESAAKKFLKKIPPLVKIVRVLRDIFIYKDTEAITETEKFRVYVMYHFRRADENYLIAEFTPKSQDNFIHDLEALLPEFESRAKSRNATLIPRAVISSETPESVRKSLFELGVRVIEI